MRRGPRDHAYTSPLTGPVGTPAAPPHPPPMTRPRWPPPPHAQREPGIRHPRGGPPPPPRVRWRPLRSRGAHTACRDTATQLRRPRRGQRPSGCFRPSSGRIDPPEIRPTTWPYPTTHPAPMPYSTTERWPPPPLVVSVPSDHVVRSHPHHPPRQEAAGQREPGSYHRALARQRSVLQFTVSFVVLVVCSCIEAAIASRFEAAIASRIPAPAAPRPAAASVSHVRAARRARRPLHPLPLRPGLGEG